MKEFRFLYKKSLKKISQVISNVHFDRASIPQVFCNIFVYKIHSWKIEIKQSPAFYPLKKKKVMIQSVFV